MSNLGEMKRIIRKSLLPFSAAVLMAAATALPAVAQEPIQQQDRDQIQTRDQNRLRDRDQLRERIRELERQQKQDRDAVHAAITEFGWDSDQADAAQEKLFQTSSKYRNMRRSLSSQGVAVPPPAGPSADGRGFRNAPGRESWDGPGFGRRGGRGGGGGHHGRGHCRCCGW